MVELLSDAAGRYLVFSVNGAALLTVRLWVALTFVLAAIGLVEFTYLYAWARGFEFSERLRRAETQSYRAQIQHQDLVRKGVPDLSYGIEQWTRPAENTDVPKRLN